MKEDMERMGRPQWFGFFPWTMVVFLLLGCEVFDSKSTVRVATYPPPKITDISARVDGVSITIASDMYYPSRQDFNYYIILYGEQGTSFQSEIDNSEIASLTAVEKITNYLSRTTKPSVSGSYLNPITVIIPFSNSERTLLEPLQSYNFTAIAWGYNESYGRLFENNGWLYSKVATPVSIHIPIFTNITIAAGGRLVNEVIGGGVGGGWSVSTDSSKTDAVVFTNRNFLGLPEVGNPNIMMATGGIGIVSLGYASFDTSQTLPGGDGDYVDKKIPSNYFSVVAGQVFGLKNFESNTYARMRIESISGGDIQIKMAYSTVPEKKKF